MVHLSIRHASDTVCYLYCVGLVMSPRRMPCVRSHYLGRGEEQLHLLLVPGEVLQQLFAVPFPLVLEWLQSEQVGNPHHYCELV